MNKSFITRVILIAVVLIPLPTIAKVTYADIVAADAPKRLADLKADEEYMAQLKPLTVSGEESAVSEWRTIYTGRTTGSISIPASATQIYVVTDGEVVTFPASAPAFVIQSMKYDNQKVINATWNGSSVSGQSVKYQYSYDCRGGEHTCWRNATAAIGVKQVMVK